MSKELNQGNEGNLDNNYYVVPRLNVYRFTASDNIMSDSGKGGDIELDPEGPSGPGGGGGGLIEDF